MVVKQDSYIRVFVWVNFNQEGKKKVMKKINPSRNQRIDACSEKVREFFYHVVMGHQSMALVDQFNSEWRVLASDFGLHKKLTLREYEKEVENLVKSWKSRLTH